jgi:hypothetical protein
MKHFSGPPLVTLWLCTLLAALTIPAAFGIGGTLTNLSEKAGDLRTQATTYTRVVYHADPLWDCVALIVESSSGVAVGDGDCYRVDPERDWEGYAIWVDVAP